MIDTLEVPVQGSIAALLAILILLSACGSSPGEGTGSADPGATPAPSSISGERAATDPTPGTLQGRYVVSEVEVSGVVSIIAAENAISMTFTPPASYRRESRRKGVVDHVDSGQFQIEGNELVLKAAISDGTVHSTPVERRYGVQVSMNGEEITLSSPDGRRAVFRRTN